MSSSSGSHVDGWIVFKKHVLYTKIMNCLVHQAGKFSTKDEIFIAVSVIHYSSELNALNAQRQILVLRLHVSATQTFSGFLLRSRSRDSNKSYRLNLILIYES
jgi:hypothetical protein